MDRTDLEVWCVFWQFNEILFSNTSIWKEGGRLVSHARKEDTMSLPRQFVEEVDQTLFSQEFLGCFMTLFMGSILIAIPTLIVLGVLWMVGVV